MTAYVEFAVSGMTCAACVRRVERAALQVPGVSQASVNLATERARVALPEASSERIDEVRRAIQAAGYEAEPLSPTRSADSDASTLPVKILESQARERIRLRRDLVLSAFLALPIFLLSMLPMVLPRGMERMMQWMSMERWNLLLWVLATLVQFGPGWQFYRHAWSSLRSRTPDMNLLVAIGTTAAYVYSTVVTFWPDALPPQARHVYFESSAVVIAFVLLGKFLETSSKQKTRDALQALTKLQPREALRIDGDRVVAVPVETLRVGDKVQIRAGEAVPIDGEIESGESFLDEGMVTGEPIPVEKRSGDPVIGGTINGNGVLQMRVTAIGGETFLARITTMVSDAQANKPPIQQLVDRVVAWFAPCTLVVAAVTAVAWLVLGGDDRWADALVHSVSVLIVACPCAMGLATPISMMVGTGRGAELGILFRTGQALQQLESIRRIALDKTGTLTLGQPHLDRVESIGEWTSDQVLRIAASAVRSSQHPISQAISNALPPDMAFLEVTDSQAVPGSGVEARLFDGRKVQVGSLRWLQQLGCLKERQQPLADSVLALGKSCTGVAIDGDWIGWITVTDPLKPEAMSAIGQLHALGVQSWILSGDHRSVVESIARELGVDGAEGALLPQDKEQRISRWRQERIPTAFVGDGINDAPALASADVGMAIGTGTEVAVSAADVVLVSGNLRGLPMAIRLARQIMRNIRINLAWAFGYNALLIPIAAGILVPWNGWYLTPMMAALAMSASSVLVVFNAMRLRWFRP